jgi:hypothetical protein
VLGKPLMVNLAHVASGTSFGMAHVMEECSNNPDWLFSSAALYAHTIAVRSARGVCIDNGPRSRIFSVQCIEMYGSS